jgi:uncharacterized tellurite resistance protein B-like protein
MRRHFTESHHCWKPMSYQIDRKHRLRLMQFLCSFAWADGKVRKQEKILVRRFAEFLDFDDEAIRNIEAWLKQAPRLEEFDTSELSRADRVIFVEAIESVILADGKIAAEEQALFDRFLSWNPED